MHVAEGLSQQIHLLVIVQGRPGGPLFHPLHLGHLRRADVEVLALGQHRDHTVDSPADEVQTVHLFHIVLVDVVAHFDDQLETGSAGAGPAGGRRQSAEKPHPDDEGDPTPPHG